ncbi:MAG: hypothetical protein JXB15_08790 [Anaerolineales bacterium]|nr:hypothetical protein [Anaerolineales bacterium]
MSKKTKKQSRKISGASSGASTASRSNGGSSLSSASGSGMFEREFKPDYSQTIKDLKRIGVLAGSFFAVLVILSFFLR